MSDRKLWDVLVETEKDRDEWKARAEAAERDLAKAKRCAIIYSNVIANHCIAMQAAVIDGKLQSPAHGLQWILNTLYGPGLLPDLDEAKALGGAQAWFDRETEKHAMHREAIEQLQRVRKEMES